MTDDAKAALALRQQQTKAVAEHLTKLFSPVTAFVLITVPADAPIEGICSASTITPEALNRVLLTVIRAMRNEKKAKVTKH